MESRPHSTSRVRAFFARADDPYLGADLPTALRLGAYLWIIGSALTTLMLPLSHPDVALGRWGWPIAAVVVLGGLLGARWLARGNVSWNQLLVASYVAVGQVALLDWLAGGSGTPYAELYLLAALYAGALHPPRRVLGVLAAITLACAAPLVYDTVSTARLGQTSLRLLLLAVIALLASALMRIVRAQRVNLRTRGDQAEQLARVDELTGLPNRRAFVEAVATEISRARRFDSPVCLVLGDIDEFKRINDVHGHQAGDACLQSVAQALRTTLRQYDACFRWGGDEFALLLPETARDGAEVVCRRVASAIAGCSAPDGSPLRMTCAPAELDDAMTADDLVAAADAELLVRKRRPLTLARTA